jgi:phosphoribosylaminoimidazole-succinocarboxamide synthase
VTVVLPSELTLDLPRYRRGKVRDTYDLGDSLLFVTSDRISAFDVVLPTLIPYKGIVLNQLSSFWFGQISHIVPNHLIHTGVPPSFNIDHSLDEWLAPRSMVVRKAERIEIECVVRGYLAGSAWTEYLTIGSIAGLPMHPGLLQSAQLDEPIFAPAIKNDAGHDQNIPLVQLRDLVGTELAHRLEELSKTLFAFAANLVSGAGMILADTKFEFGLVNGELTLIDEALTPDSSRFWDAEDYQPGRDQMSFDKQFVRDWLKQCGWNREPPAPALPEEVVTGTTGRYLEAYRRLTGHPLAQ